MSELLTSIPDPVWLAGQIRKGMICILPTDTFYGFHVSVYCPDGIERVRRLKRQPDGRSYVVLATPDHFQDLGIVSQPERIRILNDTWPAPLTVVFKSRNVSLFPDGTVAVRVPDHPVWIALFQQGSPPVISTSVNRSGDPPLENTEDIRKTFLEGVDIMLDLGSSPAGLPSTIIDLTTDIPKLIREGVYAVNRAFLEALTIS